jgi:hypothetical protein
VYSVFNGCPAFIVTVRHTNVHRAVPWLPLSFSLALLVRKINRFRFRRVLIDLGFLGAIILQGLLNGKDRDTLAVTASVRKAEQADIVGSHWCVDVIVGSLDDSEILERAAEHSDGANLWHIKW